MINLRVSNGTAVISGLKAGRRRKVQVAAARSERAIEPRPVRAAASARVSDATPSSRSARRRKGALPSDAWSAWYERA